MNSGKTVFSQLIDFLPPYEFRRCVDRYHGNHKVKSFSCWDQFLCMAFAQLTYRESLKDIETCLRAVEFAATKPLGFTVSTPKRIVPTDHPTIKLPIANASTEFCSNAIQASAGVHTIGSS